MKNALIRKNKPPPERRLEGSSTGKDPARHPGSVKKAPFQLQVNISQIGSLVNSSHYKRSMHS